MVETHSTKWESQKKMEKAGNMTGGVDYEICKKRERRISHGF